MRDSNPRRDQGFLALHWKAFSQGLLHTGCVLGNGGCIANSSLLQVRDTTQRRRPLTFSTHVKLVNKGIFTLVTPSSVFDGHINFF